MNTKHRFTFPAQALQTIHEMPMEFDLHVNRGDLVEFEWMPGDVWVVMEKKYTVSGDNTIRYIDYRVEKHIPIETH